MSKPTLEEKQAFAAKVRARNYAASLRLEGLKPGVVAQIRELFGNSVI